MRIINPIIPVMDLNDPRLDIYARLSETQLLHYREPDTGIFIAESPKVIARAMDAGYEPVSMLVEDRQLHDSETEAIAMRFPETPIYIASCEVLKHLTGFPMVRGMLCGMNRKKMLSLEEICKGKHRIALLENVVNPTNVGAIFRSAAALNMDAVVLTSGCSDPLYRRAARVSMGTVFQIPWTVLDKKTDWPGQGMQQLRELGFRTAAMALREDSVSIDDPALLAEEKLAVLLGTEGDGLLPQTIEVCDYTVRIPMSHGVDSLNVAAASAVVFWQLTRH